MQIFFFRGTQPNLTALLPSCLCPYFSFSFSLLQNATIRSFDWHMQQRSAPLATHRRLLGTGPHIPFFFSSLIFCSLPFCFVFDYFLSLAFFSSACLLVFTPLSHILGFLCFLGAGCRVYKPFNPLLGETYELVRPDLGYRSLAEQVIICVGFSSSFLRIWSLSSFCDCLAKP